MPRAHWSRVRYRDDCGRDHHRSPSDGSSSPRRSRGRSPLGTASSARCCSTRDQAIYLFEPEAGGAPACYGEVRSRLAAVLTDGARRPTATRTPTCWAPCSAATGHGKSPTTIWPLYFYAHEGPGEVLCHDVFLNGGLWLAVGPDGEPLPT